MDAVTILKSSFFAIFPTCSEGGSPSILTLVGNGALIPVMTKEASVDIPNSFTIKELNNLAIEKAVQNTQGISLETLKKYALEKGVNDAKWNLLTGDKKEIYTLARKSYFVVKEDGDGGPHDMIHTENFVLVDSDKRIRGYYDGTDKTAMESLMKDITTLKIEYGFED